MERRKDKVESGFLLWNILATNLGVYPTFENLPAGERAGLVIGWVGGGGREGESLGKEWILCLAHRASITLLSPHTPSQK